MHSGQAMNALPLQQPRQRLPRAFPSPRCTPLRQSTIMHAEQPCADTYAVPADISVHLSTIAAVSGTSEPRRKRLKCVLDCVEPGQHGTAGA